MVFKNKFFVSMCVLIGWSFLGKAMKQRAVLSLSEIPAHQPSCTPSDFYDSQGAPRYLTQRSPQRHDITVISPTQEDDESTGEVIESSQNPTIVVTQDTDISLESMGRMIVNLPDPERRIILWQIAALIDASKSRTHSDFEDNMAMLGQHSMVDLLEDVSSGAKRTCSRGAQTDPEKEQAPKKRSRE